MTKRLTDEEFRAFLKRNKSYRVTYWLGQIVSVAIVFTTILALIAAIKWLVSYLIG